MQRHLIHMVCGSTGAGKTTYAVRLCERISGVQFSIDAWMNQLFWMDTPQPLDPAWSLERVRRCNRQIWETARQVASAGIACVLDLGFGRAEQRREVADTARAAGLSAQLHFIDVPAEERWRRVQARNAEKGATYQLGFDVTREMFEFVESLWEAPSDQEMLAYDGVRVTT
jgi:predicted kinase